MEFDQTSTYASTSLGQWKIVITYMCIQTSAKISSFRYFRFWNGTSTYALITELRALDLTSSTPGTGSSFKSVIGISAFE